MDLIANIKQTVRIEDLVSRLHIERGRKSGKGFFIKSIYKNDDDNPSLQINVLDDSFYCFATGNGGDVIQFYQDFYNIAETKQAIKELAQLYGLIDGNNYRPAHNLRSEKKQVDLISKALFSALSPKEKEMFSEEFAKRFPSFPLSLERTMQVDEAFFFEFQKVENEILYPIRKRRVEINSEIFTEFYNYCNNLPGDKPFHDYLVGTRKLAERKVIAFKLFFVIDYYKVNSHMKKAFDLEDLQRSGLFNKKDDGTGNLIFYNHRLIIPYIHNGEIVYLRGRYFDQNNNWQLPEKQSKYIGLGNDALDVNRAKRFYNSDVLSTMLTGEKILLVEGEFDTIAGECLGFNTIGIPGAQNLPTIKMFKKLLPYQVTICGDNDTAGNGMIEKVKEIFMQLKKEISIKHLPTKDLNDLLAA